MRIIPDGTLEKQKDLLKPVDIVSWVVGNTIEITDEDWVLIVMNFNADELYPNEFPQYLRELIKLAGEGE